MLNIGTKVFVKYLFKDDRPGAQKSPGFIEREYGYVMRYEDNGYYLILHEDDLAYRDDEAETYGVYIHEDEMVNIDTYRPKFKIGDKVKICAPTEHDTNYYTPGWMYEMRNHIGDVVTIASCNGYPNCYRVKENKWVWEDVSFEPLSTFVGFEKVGGIMLETGTEVFLKKIFKDDNRPTRLLSGREILSSFSISCRKAFITEHIGRGYYSVSNDKDGWNTIGVVHEDEVVNMDTYEPKFKVGDMV